MDAVISVQLFVDVIVFLKRQAAEGGKQAVRIRRLNESIFTSAPKLEAFGVKEKVQYITFISL